MTARRASSLVDGAIHVSYHSAHRRRRPKFEFHRIPLVAHDRHDRLVRVDAALNRFRLHPAIAQIANRSPVHRHMLDRFCALGIPTLQRLVLTVLARDTQMLADHP